MPMSPPVGFRENSFRAQRSIHHQQNSQQDHQQERSGRQSRSLRRTLKDDYHRSPSPVPPPPNDFRDSLQSKVGRISNERTSPQRQQQRKQKESQSRMESASPAPPSSQYFMRSPSPPKVSQKYNCCYN